MIVIENLESDDDSREVQLATLDMSREDSPLRGQVLRPSIIALAQAVNMQHDENSPLDKLNLTYSFSKSRQYNHKCCIIHYRSEIIM